MSMTTERLREWHQARPFLPFDIHMADGRRLPVVHPELLAIIPPGRTIVVAKKNGSTEMVDLLLVTSLELRGNGSRKLKAMR
jgi:hypothetical protein